MTIPRRAVTGLATALAIASVTLLASASPASAAAPGAECSLTPRSVTVYEKAKTVKFGVRSDYRYWALRIKGFNPTPSHDEGREDVYWQFYAPGLENRQAGRYAVTVNLNQTGHASEPEATCRTSLNIRRGSSVSLVVKKVSGGRQLSGRLRRIGFGVWPEAYYQSPAKMWAGFKGQRVRIQYKTGDGRWVTTATVKTTAGGRFSVTKKLGQHHWRAVYAGSATTGARTSGTVTR